MISGIPEKRNIEEEKALIKRVQQNNDISAMKELHRIYRGIISKAITDSGIGSFQDREISELEARMVIERSIKESFDLNRQNIPSTYLYSQIVNVLRRKKDQLRNPVSAPSEEISRKMSIYYPVLEDLKRELNREPTDAEVFAEIEKQRDEAKKIGKKRGTDFTLKDIQKIKSMTRTDMIGNRLVGGEDRVGSPITRSEQLSQSMAPSAETLYQRQREESRINTIMAEMNLTRGERRAIYSFLGMGEFKGKPAPNHNQAALNGQITNYRLRQILNQISTKI